MYFSSLIFHFIVQIWVDVFLIVFHFKCFIFKYVFNLIFLLIISNYPWSILFVHSKLISLCLLIIFFFFLLYFPLDGKTISDVNAKLSKIIETFRQRSPRREVIPIDEVMAVALMDVQLLNYNWNDLIFVFYY